LSALLILFVNNLLPIFLAAGAGYLLSKRLPLDPRTFSRITFYIFSPCLVFTLLTHSKLNNSDILQMMLFAGLTMTLVGLITLVIGRFARLERSMLCALLLTSIFMNAGNFGLPVLLFAFNDTVLSFGSLYFVTNLLLTYTAGIVIASMGKASFSQAARNVLTIPTIYALILAMIILSTGWQLPIFLERTAQLLGDASIPSMLVLLGLQFQRIQWSGRGFPLMLASSMRLLAAPAIALLLARIMNLQGAARQAGVLESAMPTAVLTTVLATEYDVEPSFVTAVVIVTTLLSPLVLTPLLAYLGG